MITCLIGRDHEWIPIRRDRRKCIRCKLIIHDIGPISPDPDPGTIGNGPQIAASDAGSGRNR